jgi:hypothetical protein
VESFDDEVKRKLNNVDKVSRLIGTFVSTDGLRAVVDVGGGRIPADFSGYLPEVNEPVWVLVVNGTYTILGPTQLRPDRGTILAPPTGNLVQLSTPIGNITCPYASGLSLAIGQVVKLGAWSGGSFVYAIMSTQPAPDTPPGPPDPGISDREQVFIATEAGSYRSGSGWWQAQVWASDNNQGIWGYGSKIPDTIPASAIPLSIEIYISANQISGSPPVFALHAYGGTTGAPAPTFIGDTPVAVTPGWVALPTSFINNLKAGGGSYGVGVNHGGYSIFKSLGEDPMSGALRIRWRG